jgi:phosphomannomutase
MLDFNERYLVYQRAYVRLDAIKNAPFNVLVDSMHGVGDSHIENALKGGKIKVTTMRGTRDVNFGGHAPEPIPSYLVEATARMKKREFDLCVVTDGDADRVGAIRPGGEFITPGIILALILIHFCEDLGKKGNIVTTVSNTGLLYKVAKKHGLKVYETPVGFKYVSEIMRREPILLGGEESGGLGFPDYMYERDGVLSGLLLMEMMAMRNQTIDQILNDVEKEFGKLFYLRKDTEYPNEMKPKLFKHLLQNPPETLEGQKVVEVNSKDGVKFILEDGSWMLYRLSGTEPLLRIYSEATSQGLAERLVAQGKELAFNLPVSV